MQIPESFAQTVQSLHILLFRSYKRLIHKCYIRMDREEICTRYVNNNRNMRKKQAYLHIRLKMILVRDHRLSTKTWAKREENCLPGLRPCLAHISLLSYNNLLDP